MPFDPITAQPEQIGGNFDASTAIPDDQSSGADGGNGMGTDNSPMSLPAVAAGAIDNFLPSAAHAAGSIYSALRHPIDTAETVGSDVKGAAQELDTALGVNPSALPATQDEQHFDALKSYFQNRYGSINNVKKALATDPAGVGLDLSTLFTGGEGALADAPGVAGRIGNAAGQAADITNPALTAVKGVKAAVPLAAKGAADIIGNLTTHTGSMPLEYAYQAGQQGGNAAQAFLDNMRGNVPIEQVVDSAKDALSQIRANRSQAYKAGMAGVGQDQTVLSFDPIDKAMAQTDSVKNFKGQDISASTADTRNEISSIIDEWKALDPAEYHTPEGFDALKQKIGDVRDNLPYGTPQRVVANAAYNSVRGAITSQAPAYAKVMQDYQEGSDLIDNIQRTLSLNPKASVDTSLRKLQSIMRNNVNTNYGYRADLMNHLTNAGAPTLPYQLAGQSLNRLTPRGLGATEAGLGGIGAILAGRPEALAAAPFFSPRIMGEGAYYLGKASPATETLEDIATGASKAAPGTFQAGQAQATAPGYAKGGHIHQKAAEADPEPSDAQVKAGNYRHGHLRLHGFDISIETPKGAARRGIGANGKGWENRHPLAHYGYVRGTVGADSEHCDCYIGPHPESERIFVVDQSDPKTRQFDEHKLVFGARTLKEAKSIYDQGFSDGSGPHRRRTVHQTSPDDLREWLDSGMTKKPFSEGA